MIKGLYITEAGMTPKLARMEIIANNLANINTTGFKRDKAFTMALDDATAATEASGTSQQELIYEATDFSEGTLRPTNNPLDIALQGRGFFAVQTPDGVRYTRNGNLQLSLDGTIVTGGGYPVLGANGNLQVPDVQHLQAGSIHINETGEVMIDKQSIGTLRVVDFADYLAIHKDGTSLFRVDPGTLETSALGTQTAIKQGYLEDSNVDGIREMISMIDVSRAFEADQKALRAQDATLDKTNSVGQV